MFRNILFIFCLFSIQFIQAQDDIEEEWEIKEYTLWGPQIGGGLSSISADEDYAPTYSVGLVGDWLAWGDIATIRLETNFMRYETLVFEKDSLIRKGVSFIDVPLTARWTFLFFSNFSLSGGLGAQFALNENVKNGVYVTIGLDYTIWSQSVPFYVGINAKHGQWNTSTNANYPVKPTNVQLVIGVLFEGTGY